MVEILTDFARELRAAGIPVSTVEVLDAAAAIGHTDLADRASFKAALGASMVKHLRHLDVFDVAFETFFALVRPAGSVGADSSEMTDAELAAAVLEALRADDRDELVRLARLAVARLAGIEPGRPVGGTYYLYRTMRRLGGEALLESLLGSLAQETPMQSRLEAEEARERFEAFRDAVADEIRRQLVADRGAAAVAKTLRRPVIEDVELMHATQAELATIEALIGPLTRKLAARMAFRRRRLDRGRLDFRRTIRNSLATGGVPAAPVYRRPRPHRPEIVMLCDVSGSMATFSRFTLQFVYAMAEEFSRLRSFVFVDGVDEVTDHLGSGVDFADAMTRVAGEAKVVWLDGHSDYGNALEQFWAQYGGSVTPRSTVIITGDARSNYRPPRSEVVREIVKEARAVYWLNPESVGYWNTGDSVMAAYSAYCDGVFEVRNLRQLEAFVERVSMASRRPIDREKALQP